MWLRPFDGFRPGFIPDMPKQRYGRNAPNVSSSFGGPYPPLKCQSKYFDCQFETNASAGNDWSSAVVPMDFRMGNDGATVTAYTGASLIPSASGYGYGEVSGSRYIIRKLKVRGVLRGGLKEQSGATVSGTTMRLILVQDMQPNGSQAAASAFLTDWALAAQNIASFMSISSGSGGRFRFLEDRLVVLNNTGAAVVDAAYGVAQSSETAVFEFTRKWPRGLEVFITPGAAAPAVTQLANCNIFLVCQSSNTGTQVSIAGCSRCVYEDY